VKLAAASCDLLCGVPQVVAYLLVQGVVMEGVQAAFNDSTATREALDSHKFSPSSTLALIDAVTLAANGPAAAAAGTSPRVTLRGSPNITHTIHTHYKDEGVE
jgi:hypothetical protein